MSDIQHTVCWRPRRWRHLFKNGPLLWRERDGAPSRTKLGLPQTTAAPGHSEAAKSPPDDGNDKMMTNSWRDCQPPQLHAELLCCRLLRPLTPTGTDSLWIWKSCHKRRPDIATWHFKTKLYFTALTQAICEFMPTYVYILQVSALEGCFTALFKTEISQHLLILKIRKKLG